VNSVACVKDFFTDRHQHAAGSIRSIPVPQVWLTYEELAEMFSLEAETVRAEVISHGWPRRRCSDSVTRVKLPPGAAHEYMVAYVIAAGQARSETFPESPVLDLQRQAAALAGELSQRGSALAESAQKAMASLTFQGAKPDDGAAQEKRSAA
jgi:hypothetical protein